MRLGGHLGDTVSALVDGQLDAAEEERAWNHVHRCPACRRLVEHEGWTKRRLRGAAADEPSAQLIGSLYELHARDAQGAHGPHDDRHADAARVQASWAEVARLEQHGRGRRRAGIAAVGVGSVSAAVLGLSTLSGAPLGIGNAPAKAPTSSLSGPSSSPASPVSSPAAPGSSAALLRRDPLWVGGAPRGDARRTLPVASPR